MGDDSGRADRTPEEILDDYRRHGLAGEVGFGTSPAVLVVDFIRGFTEASSPLAADFDAELEATARRVRCGDLEFHVLGKRLHGCPSRSIARKPEAGQHAADLRQVAHEDRRQINQIAAAGITLGCGGTNYCPNEPVTRGQMAAFLVRGLEF